VDSWAGNVKFKQGLKRIELGYKNDATVKKEKKQ